jgi:hypothetical protein
MPPTFAALRLLSASFARFASAFAARVARATFAFAAAFFF